MKKKYIIMMIIILIILLFALLLFKAFKPKEKEVKKEKPIPVEKKRRHEFSYPKTIRKNKQLWFKLL